MVAGRFGAPTAEARAANLLALNLAAAEVARRGHVPLIGVNAALPVLEAAGHGFDHRWMMEICLALAARCDACLRVSRSPGADREAELIRAAGRPVWESLDDVPPAAGMHVQETRPLLHFDDLAVGDRYETGAHPLTAAEIVSYASAWDPQPFHLDAAAARDSLFGEFVASGWHVASLMMRLIVTQGWRLAGGQIGLQVDELVFRATRPGDSLRVIGEVLELRASRSKPDRGLARVRLTVMNQRDEPSLSCVVTQIILRKRGA